MTPEQELQRRGEPVLVFGKPGTIEWGGVTRPASVYLEQGGRIGGLKLEELTPDPGGARPVWLSVTGGA
jgi:hypothetical protein